MGTKKNTYVVEHRVYKDPKNPTTSDYDVEYPMTSTEAVITTSTSETMETRLQRIENWQKSIPLSQNTDLNTVLDNGFYHCETDEYASKFKNLPTTSNGKTTNRFAFSLLVEKQAGVKQTLTYYALSSDPVETFVRCYYSFVKSWTPWEKIATTNDITNIRNDVCVTTGKGIYFGDFVENSDPVRIIRENTANDHTKLCIDIGDNFYQDSTKNVVDSFVIRTTNGYFSPTSILPLHEAMTVFTDGIICTRDGTSKVWQDYTMPFLATQTGYMKFSNGFTIQWGSNGNLTYDNLVTFPISFSALYSVVVTADHFTQTKSTVCACSVTNFRTLVDPIPGLVRWIAMGYITP